MRKSEILFIGVDGEQAINAVLSGVPILVIKNWLGHSKIQNTLIYMQVLGNDTRHFYEGLNF